MLLDVLPVDAVSSIEDGVLVEDGTAAGLREAAGKVAALQGDLEGQRVGFNVSTADDLVGRDELVASAHDHGRWQARHDHPLRGG